MVTPIPTRNIGGSEVFVSELGFGAGFLGDPSRATPEAQAQATLQRAWDLGIRYFDTAPWYGHTKSEHRVGYFLRDKPRDEFVLSTKVGRLYSRPRVIDNFGSTEHGGRWLGGLPFIPRFDYSASGIRRAYEDSLQRLGVNRVDCLVIHDLDPRHQRGAAGVERALEQLDAGGGYQELATLKGRHEIRAIGAGVNHVGMIPKFLERFQIDYFLVAMPYTLLDQALLHEEMQMCEERGVKVVIGAVFASGILATGAIADARYGYQAAAPEMLEKVAAIEKICDQFGVALNAAALQFTLAHSSVAAVIPGADSPQQVEQNAQGYRAKIPPAFWQTLRTANLIDPVAPVPKT